MPKQRFDLSYYGKKYNPVTDNHKRVPETHILRKPEKNKKFHRLQSPVTTPLVIFPHEKKINVRKTKKK
ncbi:hypothetical protein B5X24_HaOG204611 [Helicoverpa armigera]|nr:hypothetical protein B5X24_HaOG204611 [Helicoverpa armigera]